MSKAEDFIRRTVGDNIVGRGLVHILNNKDILLALGILVIISLLIIPLSPILMDLLIATNLSLAVLILLVSLYLKIRWNFLLFQLFFWLLLCSDWA